jgi:UDP-N-acetylmuramate: L-alanyl-gamma-D-glutamyl-meso-diaminopimelate ligase
MGAVALALSRAGWRVTGSDEGAYPPMSELLKEQGIKVMMPFDPANIPVTAELIVVGKRVRDNNPELRHAIAEGLQYCSFPALLRRLFLDRSRNAVVAGGLGKTTTTAMLAWVLEDAGQSPDYLIGGLARNFEVPARFAGAYLAVMEGDEYASCFDDPQPKFMHYRAEVAIVTNVVEDHPDLYPDIRAVEDSFAKLVRSLPSSGCLVIPDDDEHAARIGALCTCRSARVGFSLEADHRITDLRFSPSASRFRLGKTDFVLPLCGRMNVRNAAMAAVAAAHFGIPYPSSADAIARFAGVLNRQQRLVLGRYTVVTDKASHPTALRALFEATRQEYPGRRIVSVILPRGTGGKNWIYQRHLPSALAKTDRVLVLGAYEHNPEPKRTWEAGPFSTDSLISDLADRGVPAASITNCNDLPDTLRNCLAPDDVIVLSVPEQATELLAAIESALEAR